MSLRTRSRKSPPAEEEQSPPGAPLPPSSQQAITQALASTAHLANLLPTSTLLAFQLLIPVFTNNGTCDAVTRLLTQALLLLLAAFCFLACFTDSFRGADGRICYGLATRRGMWLFNYNEAASGQLPGLSKYRARGIDLVHAVLSVLVFASVALRDRNTVRCLYPLPSHEAQEVLDILPLGVGVLCGGLFVLFPTRRHGIGYPVTNGN